MTFAEIQRAVNSAIRVKELQNKEKASYDYILAKLIVKGISNVLGDKSEYPTIDKAYPGIFDDELKEQQEKIEEQKISLSAIRFKQFAQSHNTKYKGVQ